MSKATDYLNTDAIFSDESPNFVNPNEPNSSEPITIQIRVGRDNVDEVFLACRGQELCLHKINHNEFFDFYSITMPPLKKKLSYHFHIRKNRKSYYYNKRGLHNTIDKMFDFVVIPNFNTPDWAKGAVMYHIYVDRFCNGDKTNDPVNNEYAYLGQAAKNISNWNQELANLDVANFYGGDLQGVIDKIPYLKELGIEAIYLSPIFVSPSNHKYDIQDYAYVDPHLGVIAEDGGEPLYFENFYNRFATKYMRRTAQKANLEASNRLFCRLVELAHQNGIKVILDGVFNHCGAFNKWMDKEGFYELMGYEKGAYNNEESPYRKYFRWKGEEYDSWWGFDNHPKLNYEESAELYEYMMEIGAKWVKKPFNADGWRLDVGADLGYSKEFNHKFWRDFRKAVKSANKEAIILAEHYGDPQDWLQGDQWDTIMNYDAFMEPISWFLTGMQKHSEEFRTDMLCNAMAFEEAMRYQTSRLTAQSMYTSMNQLSNHDHSRFLTRTNMKTGRLHTVGAAAASHGINKNIMMEAVVFQMTWPGSPTLYYGDEAGLTGWTDPDNRRTYPWGKEDTMLLAFHKKIIEIRKKYKALSTGSVKFLYSHFGILSYGRWDADCCFVIILNNNFSEQQLDIPVWKANVQKNGRLTQLISTGDDSFSVEAKVYDVVDGSMNITMPAFSSVVLMDSYRKPTKS